MDNFFNNLSSAILEFVITYNETVVGKIVDSKKEETGKKEPEHFFYTILHKTISTLDTANYAIRNFHTKFHFRISLYILLRAIMADLIVGEYVIKSGKEGEELEKLIKSVNADHVFYAYESISKNERVIESLSETDLEERQDQFRKLFPTFFVDGKCIEHISSSPSNMVRTIFSQRKKGDDLRFLSHAYYYYDKFSKYEHLGEFTFNLTHGVYYSHLLKDTYEEVFICLNVILSALMNVTQIWPDIDRAALQKLVDRIMEFTPDKMPQS